MKVSAIVFAGIFVSTSCLSGQSAQPETPSNGAAASQKTYAPPTQSERLREYFRHTYGLASFLEAGARAGIDQARDRPSGWPEGAEGYGERYGSAMGLIVVRGTTEYLLSDLFHEDLRHIPCGSGCEESKFKLALEDTFMARRGSDGHKTLSIARLAAPISGTLVASTWRPDGSGNRNIGSEIGISYGFIFARNLVREFIKH